MEFGTQTLDSSLVDIASFDFGVQTLLNSVTKEQGSQTRNLHDRFMMGGARNIRTSLFT